MSAKKVQTIKDWPKPKVAKEVQSFLGFAKFYRRFIEGFSKICRQLTELTRKDQKYPCATECQESFDLLKRGTDPGALLSPETYSRGDRQY